MSLPGQYIPIDSIHDLDLEKITLPEINKRYIDRQGFRYATRFNLKTRRIEVVRIVKGVQEAERVRTQIKKDKIRQADPVSTSIAHTTESLTESPYDVMGDEEIDAGMSDTVYESAPGLELDTKSPPPDHAASADIAASGKFYEHSFMEECGDDFEKIKERLNGTTKLIKNSRYFEIHRSSEVDEALRDIDLEGIQKSDDALNYYKELVSYPRQSSYYVSRMSKEQKKLMDAYESEEEKLVLIRRWEIRDSFGRAYESISTLSKRILAILSEVPQENLNALPSIQKQSFEDARAATEYLLEICQEKLSRIELWRRRYP